MLNDNSHIRLLILSGVVAVLLMGICIIIAPYLSDRFGIDNRTVKSRMLFSVLLAEYVFITACLTVLFRTPSDVAQIDLTPFWSYSAIVNNTGGKFIFEVIDNVAFFIPVGLLVPMVIGYKGWRKTFIVSSFFGMSLSMLVEVTQYITRRGFCETDDVIHNLLGTIIGYLLYTVVRRIINLKN